MQSSENYDFLKDVYGKRLKLAEQIEKAETLSERNRLKAEYKQKFNGEEYIDTKSLEKRKKHNKELNNNQITLEIIKTVLEHPDDIENEYAKYFSNENSGIYYTTNPNNKKSVNKQPSIFGPTKFVASKVIEVAKLYLASIPLISQIKGANCYYMDGNKMFNQDGELIREGHFSGSSNNFYNPEIFNHKDVAKFDIDLAMSRYCLKERRRYTQEKKMSNLSGYCLHDDDFSRKTGQRFDLPIQQIGEEVNINGVQHIKLFKQNKQYIINKTEENFKKFLKNVKKNPNVKILDIDLLLHREKDNLESFINLPIKEFTEIFENAVKSGYDKIYISETLCYHSKDLVELLADIASKNNYHGDILIRRNGKYDQELTTTDEFYNTESGSIINKIYHSQEFIHLKNGKINCITENEAREIMGGSYEQNLEFNKKHDLGDKPANPKCKPEMDEINEKYFHNNKNISNKTCKMNNGVKDCTGVNM